MYFGLAGKDQIIVLDRDKRLFKAINDRYEEEVKERRSEKLFPTTKI